MLVTESSLRTVRQHNRDTPVIPMSGNAGLPAAVEALRLGALGRLVKPVPAEKLLEAGSEALGLVRLTRLPQQMRPS
jgi:DNA-binding NtrC family response regulator